MRPWILHRHLFAATICCVVSGCGLSHWAHNGFRVGPNHCRPLAPVADDWIDSGDDRVLAAPPDHWDWWVVLQDPVVDELVRTASRQNLTLRQAAARVMQARSSRAITAGNLFPQTQQSFGSFTHVQNSTTVAVPAPLRTFDEWETGFNASWELDVWGKLRRAVESADARLDASIEEYDAILVSLIAEVVTAYVEIRTFEERLKYARQNVQIQESSLELSSNRYAEGKTSELGVQLAAANLNATKATVPSLETGLRQANNRLCSLQAIPPTDLSAILGESRGIPTVPAAIAIGIPADLLRRRPDVLQAERLVAAQSAQIGIALSDLYPSVAISGDIFVASDHLGDLFKTDSTAGAIGPSFRWNILNYGRIINNVRLQDARLIELVAAYQDTVLLANQEVEDALVAFLNSQQEVELLRANADNLQKSLDLLLIQFEEGAINFSPIFVLQESLRVAQDQLAAAEGQVLINVIAVYRALGGGWQIRLPGFEPRMLATTEAPDDTAEPIPPPVPAPIGEGRDNRVRELPPLPPVDEPTEDALDD